MNLHQSGSGLELFQPCLGLGPGLVSTPQSLGLALVSVHSSLGHDSVSVLLVLATSCACSPGYSRPWQPPYKVPQIRPMQRLHSSSAVGVNIYERASATVAFTQPHKADDPDKVYSQFCSKLMRLLCRWNRRHQRWRYCKTYGLLQQSIMGNIYIYIKGNRELKFRHDGKQIF